MPKTVFLFPGQGAQSVGMGKTLYDTMPAAKRLFDEAKEILGFDLASLCWNGPEAKLNATDISQPAIFVASLAALESLKEKEPDAIASCFAAAGLSLGEYTALVFAGVMSFADGLRLVQKRGQAMQAAAEATPSGMVSVLGLEMPQIESLCQEGNKAGRVWIANLLCPGNIVLSGDNNGIAAVEQAAPGLGAMKTIRLAVAGAFHTEIMKPADQQLAAALQNVKMQPAHVPVWSNVDAQPHTDPEEIRGLLVRQVLNPVRWEETMRNLLAAGAEKFYEIGPGRVLAGLLKRVQRKMECVAVPA
jgi:[acyl-carrier-protein] S-malonyltransferase